VLSASVTMMTHREDAPSFLIHAAAILIGPGDDDIEVLSDDDILDDDDVGPSSLDHEALNDDAC
jgi:hypothetical protein